MLQAIHKKEWRFRRYMDRNTNWHTPDTLSCLRYLAGECNEARQAWMTMTRDDPRNNRMEADNDEFLAEVGDAVFMAMAALSQEHVYTVDEPTMVQPTANALDNACYNAETAIAMKSLGFDWMVATESAIWNLMSIEGFDLTQAQITWHEKIRGKHDPACSFA